MRHWILYPEAMKKRTALFVVPAAVLAGLLVLAAVPSDLNDFFLPGSQPGQSGNIEHPGKCDNCHGGYDLAVEPAFNWRGSMMAQAARDPLFWACLAVANQDVPESGDLCIRCHAPDGWLAGRSTPTDGSALNNNDREGVQCDFCHKLVRPPPLGVNPYPDDPDYTAGTYDRDQAYLATLSVIPPASANGMYIADADNAKRGPFVDAAAKHQMYYSPFHRESGICGTCHDVSNPAFNGSSNIYTLNDFGAASPSFNPYDMFPIERTYSEWLKSDYNTAQGIEAPQFGGNKQFVSTCQDCHMHDVSGVACNKRGAVYRDDLPLHDLTGGNTFIPGLVGQLFPDEVNQAALDAGVQRASGMLQKAASLDLSVASNPDGTGLLARVRVTNETGHKLPSGYPEGRRIWIDLKQFSGSTLVAESGAYDPASAELDTSGTKIYQIKPGISPEVSSATGLPEGPSFHFVLNSKIYSDNRIPPRGFTNTAFEAIQSPPIKYSYADGQYWDDTEYALQAGVDRVEVTLYYQTLSKDYVTFLWKENNTNDAGQVLYDLWAANGKSVPVAMATASVSLAPPAAAFSAEPASGYAPLSVAFTDRSLNGPTSWTWDFGDGSTSGLKDPVHEYTVPGTYTVHLTVSNEFGTDQASGNITVNELTQSPMYVADITVTRVAAKGGRYYAEGNVTVLDDGDNPVVDAGVTVAYTGPTSGTLSGTTGTDGTVSFSTRAEKNTAGSWCFEVLDATKSGYVYLPSLNVETGDCESGLKSGVISGVEAGSVMQEAMNFPNPFSSMTHIHFTLSGDTHVLLEIYSPNGERVAVLVNENLAAGEHIFTWRPAGLPDGTYIYKISAGDLVLSRRMLLAR